MYISRTFVRFNDSINNVDILDRSSKKRRKKKKKQKKKPIAR